jgi:hypothetical protein
MKMCDLVIVLLIAVIFVAGILYQYGDNPDLEIKNCVQTAVTDQQLAECARKIK